MNMKNKLSDQLLEFLATGFYSGLVPYAPGTLASFLACLVILPLILDCFYTKKLWAKKRTLRGLSGMSL